MKPIVLVGAVICVIGVGAAGTYSYVSPARTLKEIREAAESNDSERLRDLIDFDRVKTALKDDVNAQIISSARESLKDNPFQGLALAMAGMMVDRLVDSMVTPAGIAAMMDKGELKSSKPAGDTALPTVTSTEVRNDGVTIERGYDSYDRYRVRLTKESGTPDDALTLTLRRNGLFSWRLTHIAIPRAAFAQSNRP